MDAGHASLRDAVAVERSITTEPNRRRRAPEAFQICWTVALSNSSKARKLASQISEEAVALFLYMEAGSQQRHEPSIPRVLLVTRSARLRSSGYHIALVPES